MLDYSFKMLKKLYTKTRKENFNSLSDALQPLMFQTKTIFLQLYTIVGESENRKLILFKKHIIILLLQILLIIFLPAGFVLYTKFTESNSFDVKVIAMNYTSLDYCIYYFASYYSIAFVLVTIIFFHFNRENICSIFNKSDEIDRLLNELHLKANYLSVYKYCYKILFLLSVFTLWFYVVYNNASKNNVTMTKIGSLLILNFIINSIISSASAYISILLHDIELKYLMINIYISRQNKFDYFYLQKILIVYCKLNMYCKKINSIFNLLILFLFIYTFTTYTITNYVVIIYLLNKSEKNSNDHVIIVTFWNLYNLHRALIIFYKTKKAVFQVCLYLSQRCFYIVSAKIFFFSSALEIL